MKRSALILLVAGLLLAFNSQTLRKVFPGNQSTPPSAKEQKKE